MWAQAAFFTSISTGKEIVNSLSIKYLNLVKVHIESVPSTFTLGTPIQKQSSRPREDDLTFESSNWYWRVRNGDFQTPHYHGIHWNMQI